MIEESYKVIGMFEINSDTVNSLFDFCQENYKEAYANDERLLFFIKEQFDDNEHGDYLTQLQTALNTFDISNFFIIVNSTDENIERNLLAVTETVSYDPVPISYFKDGQVIRPEVVKDHTFDKFKSLNLPNDTFCVLPWISLEIGATGAFRPCCLAENQIVDDNSNPYHVTEVPLNDVLNSKHMANLREEFLAGKKPSTCKKCWDEEGAGRTSKRMNTLLRLQHYGISNVTWTDERKPLRFFDLKLGNICNLKCRICGPFSSSTYASEELKAIPVELRKGSAAYKFNEMGAWPRKDITFWDDLNEHLDDLRYLEFTGGEPFMIREHFQFLERLVEKDLAKNIEVHYNTNGTQWPEEYVHIWTHFKHVEIAFSIDNIGKRFEYERTNANWDEVNDNIEKFIKLRDGTSNLSLQLCTTVNIYNVLYLHDIVNWEHYKDFNFVFWNMLHTAPANCIKSMPNWGKRIAEAKLLQVDMDPKIEQEFTNIVKFMNGGNGVPLEELRTHIKRMDDRRGVSLEDTHPELYEIIYGEVPD